jgi:hypothetical protein
MLSLLALNAKLSRIASISFVINYRSISCHKLVALYVNHQASNFFVFSLLLLSILNVSRKTVYLFFLFMAGIFKYERSLIDEKDKKKLVERSFVAEISAFSSLQLRFHHQTDDCGYQAIYCR